MERKLSISLLALSLVLVCPNTLRAQSIAADSFGPIDFPPTADGRLVLAVDFHSHTVFSDGLVWPSIRVDEADQEGLAGIAITDHLEWQPHRDDIPNPDRNRSYDLAAAEAKSFGRE